MAVAPVTLDPAFAIAPGEPVLLLFLLAQRYVIEGVSRSGLKG